MMSRQKLQELKKTVRKMDFEPNLQTIHALIDHGLQALTELEGGPSVQAQRAELAERERQLGLAVADLRSVLMVVETDLRHRHEPDLLECAGRALFMTALMREMLRAKGPAWHRQWDWYTPRIAEEFDQPTKIGE